MVTLGVYDSESNDICVHHANPFPRNIMVDFTPDITITGILGWGLTLFVPRFAGRIPPNRLWQSVPQSRSAYNQFGRENLEPEANASDSPENAEIKHAFENAVGEHWVSEATGKWYPVARRLLKIARETLIDDEDMDNITSWMEKNMSLLEGVPHYSRASSEALLEDLSHNKTPSSISGSEATDDHRRRTTISRFFSFFLSPSCSSYGWSLSEKGWAVSRPDTIAYAFPYSSS
ncbi:hypothetical protein GGR52DRAFT_163151 [Hypoxylon sp. FL1284]|nr:hypothetical protein GGR52DRAFT_163151 [Hypoxylon sp. FL1284]